MPISPQTNRRARWALGSLAVWSIFITLLLYGSALSLPFFFDDLDLLPFAANNPLSTIWQTAGSFPYFRPFTTTVWRLVYLLFGDLNSTALHAVNLILHGLNGWLVGILAGNLFAEKRPFLPQNWRWDVAWLSSTLFLIYPFSFQAVPWVGSLSHLLVTTLLLSSLVCFVIFYHRGGVEWAFLSLLFTFLAPFAHENGIMAFPLIVAYSWLQTSSNKRRFPPWRRLIWLLPLLLWLPVWFLAPKAKSDLVLNGLEAIMQNAAYFGQGIAYPFTWLGGWFRNHWGWNDLLTALLLAFIAILFLFFVRFATQKKRLNNRFFALIKWLRSPWAFPWIWCILTTIPAIFLLSFNYTISAPRLLMVPSVGISLLWGYTFAQLWHLVRDTAVTSSRRWQMLSGLAGCLFLLLLVAQNVQFVARFMHYHALLGDVTKQAVDHVVAANRNGRSAILINFPNEVRSHTTTYPLGHEGILFLVDYLREQDLIDMQVGQQTDFALLQYSDLRTNERAYAYSLLGKGNTWLQLAAEKPNATIYLTTFANDQIWLEWVGQLQPDVPLGKTEAIFTEAETGQTISLVNGCVQAETINLKVKLLWQIETPPSISSTIYVHILDDQGQLVAQKDGFVFGGTYPMGEWQQNTLLQDVRTIPFTGNSYTAYVGLYNWMTGDRLTAVTTDNLPLPETGYQLPACNR